MLIHVQWQTHKHSPLPSILPEYFTSYQTLILSEDFYFITHKNSYIVQDPSSGAIFLLQILSIFVQL